MAFVSLTGQGVGVEIQPRLACLAEQGSCDNGFLDRFHVLWGDVRAPDALRSLSDATFDLVACNPPFWPLGRAQLPPEAERAVAHHELSLTLDQWVGSAARHLRPGGRVAAVFPALRREQLLDTLLAYGLACTRLREVKSHSGSPPGRVLVEAAATSHGGKITNLVAEPPLLVHQPGGGYGAEVSGWLGLVEQKAD